MRARNLTETSEIAGKELEKPDLKGRDMPEPMQSHVDPMAELEILMMEPSNAVPPIKGTSKRPTRSLRKGPQPRRRKATTADQPARTKKAGIVVIRVNS